MGINVSTIFMITFVMMLIRLFIILLVIWVLIEGIKALIKYNKSKGIYDEEKVIKKSLGEVIKSHRTRCKMTQEFVAEYMGVTRQTISKWETGINEPSTSHLFQLAKLFDISAQDLLKEIEF